MQSETLLYEEKTIDTEQGKPSGNLKAFFVVLFLSVLLFGCVLCYINLERQSFTKKNMTSFENITYDLYDVNSKEFKKYYEVNNIVNGITVLEMCKAYSYNSDIYINVGNTYLIYNDASMTKRYSSEEEYTLIDNMTDPRSSLYIDPYRDYKINIVYWQDSDKVRGLIFKPAASRNKEASVDIYDEAVPTQLKKVVIDNNSNHSGTPKNESSPH